VVVQDNESLDSQSRDGQLLDGQAPDRQALDRANSKESKADRASAVTLARCSAPEARQRLSFELASQLGVLPLGLLQTQGGELLTVAFHSGAAHSEGTRDLEVAVRFATGLRPKLIKVPKEDLERALIIAYHGGESALEERVEALNLSARREKAQQALLPAAPASEGEVPQFIDALLRYAVAHRASDIHLTPAREGTRVSLRVDGEVLEREGRVASCAQHEQLVRRVKVLARLNLNERTLPQDGSFISRLGLRLVSIRVSLLPTVHGERIVLRLAVDDDALTIEGLGFDARTNEVLEGLLQKREGAILLSGSTGSGKTTTLYAILEALKNKGLTLSSIEDPVEREVPGISQTALNSERGLGYDPLLRAILRQDPDVIMVGELRDAASAATALQAAITGHLVLSTIHARSVYDIITRLEHFGLSRLAIGDSVELLVTQRLLGRLCSACRVTDLRLSQQLGFEAFRGVGCAKCHYSGCVGRALVAESLSIDAQVREALRASDFCPERLAAAYSARNYSSMKERVLSLVRSGIVAGSEFQLYEDL